MRIAAAAHERMVQRQMNFDAMLTDAAITVWLGKGKKSRIAASLPWARRPQALSAEEFIADMEATARAREADEEES